MRMNHLCHGFALSLALAGGLGTDALALAPWTLQGAKSAPGRGEANTAGAAAGSFPTITAEALDRSDITLPANLEGRENLLLLSWARDQAAQLETWTAVAQALQHTHVHFRVYRIPVSATENVVFRWWDNASLRAAETDPERLHWNVPIYTDKAKLHEALGQPLDEKAVTVLLVDRAGRILWRAQGPSTAATRASLESFEEGLH